MALQKKQQIVIILIVMQIKVFGESLDHVSSTTDASVPADTTATLPDNPVLYPVVLSLNIYSDIKYRYATTVVTSTVVNPADVVQVINFTVILPESAFITRLIVLTDDKIYSSLIQEKKTNKNSVEHGSLTTHLEEGVSSDFKRFSVSVDVKPYKTVDFNLTYEQMLIRSLGVYHHVVNINPGQVVRDLSVIFKISESSKIVDLQVQELNDTNTITGTTKNELVTIERPTPTDVVVCWLPTQEQQIQIAEEGVNGQLGISYDLDRESNPQQILVEDGYFVHFFAPELISALHKHIVFVLDYSGSMGSFKREQVVNAMKFTLTNLCPSDYFSLVLFSEKAAVWYPSVINFVEQLNRAHSMYTEKIQSKSKNEELEFEYDYEEEVDNFSDYNKDIVMSNGILSASESNKKLAIEFLKSFNNYGGTNIMDGLRKGLDMTQIGERMFKNETSKPKPLIVILTDGRPNAEILDPEEIIKVFTKLNTDRIPVFSIGFGYGADIDFLCKLSLNNNGFTRNIYLNSYTHPFHQLVTFYKEISSLLLTDTDFDYFTGQVDSPSTSQTHFPTYFNGSELVVVGRFQKAINAGELITKTSTGIMKYPVIIDLYYDHFPGTRHEPSHLEKIWAYVFLQQSIDNITVQEGKERNDTIAKALDIALRYSFQTPLTSLTVGEHVEPAAATGTLDLIFDNISQMYQGSPDRNAEEIAPIEADNATQLNYTSVICVNESSMSPFN